MYTIDALIGPDNSNSFAFGLNSNREVAGLAFGYNLATGTVGTTWSDSPCRGHFEPSLLRICESGDISLDGGRSDLDCRGCGHGDVHPGV